MTDQTATTKSTDDIILPDEGNGADEEENAILLSTICKLEVENLRMRNCINNYGFNLQNRVQELEYEKNELTKALKTLKPNEDPSKFAVSENSKYVNVDFTQFLSQPGEVVDATRGGITKRPFTEGDTVRDDDHSSTQPADHTDDSNTVPTSSSTDQAACDQKEYVAEKLPKKSTRRSSFRQNSFLAQTAMGGGSKNWDAEGRGEFNDSNVPDTEDFMGNKRQSTEIALSSMRLSMQNPIMENNIQQNFLEFYIVGPESSIISGEKQPVVSRQQPTEILNRYPSENPVIMDSIADFAFPLGAFTHLTPSFAHAKAILKKHPHQYHILQFSDSQGIPTYACCLTVTSVLRLNPSNSQHKSVIVNLSPLLTRARARDVIVRFLRYARSVTLAKQQVVVNKDGVVVGYIRPRSLSSSNISPPSSSPSMTFRKFKNSVIHRLGGRTSVENATEGGSRKLSKSFDYDDKTSRVGLVADNSLLEMSPKTGFARAISLSRDARHDDSEAMSETSDDDASPTQSPISRKKPKMKKVRKSKSINDDKEPFQYLVTQRAYVFLSAKPLHTFLFRILEEIAVRESKDTADSIDSLSNMKDVDENEDTEKPVALMVDLNVAVRDNFLKYAQCHPLDKIGLSARGAIKDSIFFNFPSYIESRIRLKINRVSMNEWANAVMLALLKPSLIIYLLNALILEKSIVVYGANISLVSALTSAIVQLINPYTWEGVFIPLIPANAIEILEAPVPFVVGTNIPFHISKISPAANVLFVDEVLKCYMSPEYSEEMLSSKFLHRSLDTSVKMPINQNLRIQLNSIHNLLSRRLPSCFHQSPTTGRDVKDTENRICNFQLSYFFNEGLLSPEVRGAIKDLSQFLIQHNTMFAGDISEKDGGWRKYGVYDPFTDAYNFFPQWFLDHQTSILEFQSVLANTQLFYAYVDRMKLLYTEKQFYRRFIADFLSHRFRMRKKLSMSRFKR